MAARASIERVRSDNTIDTLDIAALRFQRKLTLQEIADKYGVSKQAIHTRLAKFAALAEPETIERYEAEKPKLLSMVEKVLLKDMLDPVRREKASLNNVAYSFSQVYQANRTSRGLAGSITEHRQAYDIEISMVDSEIKRLESRFSGTKQNDPVIDAEYDTTENTMSCKGSE